MPNGQSPVNWSRLSVPFWNCGGSLWCSSEVSRVEYLSAVTAPAAKNCVQDMKMVKSKRDTAYTTSTHPNRMSTIHTYILPLWYHNGRKFYSRINVLEMGENRNIYWKIHWQCKSSAALLLDIFVDHWSGIRDDGNSDLILSDEFGYVKCWIFLHISN